MKTSLKTTNMPSSLPGSAGAYVERKLTRIEKVIKPFGSSPEAWVELSRATQHHRSGSVYYAEVDLRLPGKVLRSTATASDIRTAIDVMADELLRQVRVYKGKLRSKYLAGARRLKQKARD